MWWESFPTRTDMPVDQLMVAYMTRAGKVSLDRFAESAPDVARRGLADYAGVPSDEVPDSDVSEWALAQPFTRDGFFADSRLADASLRSDPDTAVVSVDLESAWGDPAAELLDGLHGRVVWLTGAPHRDAVLTRLDLGERARNTGRVVVVEAPEAYRSDLAAGLASQRTDLVHIVDEAAIDGAVEDVDAATV